MGLANTISFAPVAIFIFASGFCWLMAFFILYHLIRFGVGTKPKRTAFIFLIGAIILNIITALSFAGINTQALAQFLTHSL